MEMKDENGIDRGMSFSELVATIGNPVPYKFPHEKYKIFGNTAEIDKILHANAYINISVEDVECTLSKKTTNYISTGNARGDGGVLNALKNALTNLPIGTDSISKLLFHIWIPKNMDSAMKEFASMAEFINEFSIDIDVCWGCAYSDLLRNEVKVSLIAASK